MNDLDVAALARFKEIDHGIAYLTCRNDNCEIEGIKTMSRNGHTPWPLRCPYCKQEVKLSL